MSPDYYRFVASIGTADRNVIIMFVCVSVLLVTYKLIDWYPTQWQKPARVIAQVFAVVMFATLIGMSL